MDETTDVLVTGETPEFDQGGLAADFAAGNFVTGCFDVDVVADVWAVSPMVPIDDESFSTRLVVLVVGAIDDDEAAGLALFWR